MYQKKQKKSIICTKHHAIFYFATIIIIILFVCLFVMSQNHKILTPRILMILRNGDYTCQNLVA